MRAYPKRLIEVDLPIRRISEHARREKSVRHGHISTLHIWWARRPLAACRAVICAALWPDPVDITLEDVEKARAEGKALELNTCPPTFRDKAKDLMLNWARRHLALSSPGSFTRLVAIQKDPTRLDDQGELRRVLLDFIADFANWDNSTVQEYLDTSRALTQAAHEALGGAPGTRPLVVDPFAGGGSIPLEALRVGADAFASDLNPIPVLLNKVVLEYIPKFGQRLADEVRKWGEWIKREAEKELAEFYPKDPDGATPIAYLWARTIQCEGPGCGAEVPLINQRLISKRRAVGVEFSSNGHDILTNIRCDLPVSEFGVGTVTNGKVTCPRCGFTIPAERYRQRSRDGQLGERHFCTILSLSDGTRKYRQPSDQDSAAFQSAKSRLNAISHIASKTAALTVVPNESLSLTEPRRLNVLHYGFNNWGALFNARQNLAWTTFSNLLYKAFCEIAESETDAGFAAAVSTVLGLVLSNLLQYNCNMSTWLSDGMISVFIQSSSIPMRADYAEANPLMERLVGGLLYQLERTDDVLRGFSSAFDTGGTTAHASATDRVLSDDSVAAFVTDPPYYFLISDELQPA